MADEHYKIKYLNAWKRFVVQRHLDKKAQDAAKVIQNRQKQLEIDKEKRDRQRDLAERANRMRSQMIQKSCFEVLKGRLEIKKDLDTK